MNNQKIYNYYRTINEMLNSNMQSQLERMSKVVDVWTTNVLDDRITYVFGSGHSRYIAGELCWRAGGLAPTLQIEDPSLGAAERVVGFAASFMPTYDIQSGDLLFVISNSGINPLPIEVALLGKGNGAIIVALTSETYSESAKSRHPSGKKLFEIADFILDTQNVPGDAIVDIDGLEGWKVAPASTALSVCMLNAMVAQVAQNVVDRGKKPPVLISSNVPEGDDHNASLADQLWRRLTRFPRKGTF